MNKLIAATLLALATLGLTACGDGEPSDADIAGLAKRQMPGVIGVKKLASCTKAGGSSWLCHFVVVREGKEPLQKNAVIAKDGDGNWYAI